MTQAASCSGSSPTNQALPALPGLHRLRVHYPALPRDLMASSLVRIRDGHTEPTACPSRSDQSLAWFLLMLRMESLEIGAFLWACASLQRYSSAHSALEGDRTRGTKVNPAALGRTQCVPLACRLGPCHPLQMLPLTSGGLISHHAQGLVLSCPRYICW